LIYLELKIMPNFDAIALRGRVLNVDKDEKKILKIEGKLSRSRFKTPMSFFRGEL
jgi:hypothetical protein